MSPSSRMAEYRRQAQARYAPVVATVTTPEADAACAHSGVRSFADLLRPFADVSGLNVPMRHNAEAPPYALSEISIRFHSVYECRRVKAETAEAYARRAFEPWDATDDASLSAMLDAVPTTMRETIRDANAEVTDLPASSSFDENKTKTCEGENEETLVSWFGTPWFDRFAYRARRRCAFSDFETTDHPRAIVFATAVDTSTSSESEAETSQRITSYLIDTFERMSAPYYRNPESYPPAIRSEAADPDVARHFVVMHAPTTSVSEACLKATRDALSTGSGGSEVFLTALPILSSEGVSSEGGASSDEARLNALNNLFATNAEARLVASESPSTTNTPSAVSANVALRDVDVEALRTFVRVFATTMLLPHMEKRLTALNANINSTRKGLKNQLKTFWGRNVAAAGGFGGFGGSFGALTANVTAASGNTQIASGNASNGTSGKNALEPNSEALTSSNEDSRYSFRSPECEIRLAADLAFSLRDFETAAHHYRLLQSDFKADKAFRRLGCVNESLAEALICSQPSSLGGVASSGNDPSSSSVRRDIDAAFDAAVAAHRKAIKFEVSETSNWTWRASYSHAVFLAASGAHRDAALALAAVSGDEGLQHHCAAAALEAAAFEFLRTDPIHMTRKYAMHLTLAGHRFAQAGFRAHAARCYKSALPAYEDANLDTKETRTRCFFPDGASVKTPWARAREHLHFALGRQIARCGGSRAAAAHFQELLSCADGVSAKTQATYLREFLFLDAKHGDDVGIKNDEDDDSRRDERFGVSLPEVDVGDVHVVLEDGGASQVGDTGDTERNLGFVSEKKWRLMESDGVVPAHLVNGAGGGATWLDAGKTGKKKGGEQFGVCAAGETVFFETRFRNPLSIPLTLAEVTLSCDFVPTSEKTNEEARNVTTETQSMTLLPLETRLVRLACVPTTEGILRARGVSWRLRLETKEETSSSESPPTQRSLNYVPFDIRAPRTRRGADGVSWVRDTPRLNRLALRVTPAMPRLECRLLNVPKAVPCGGVFKVTLVAKNVALGSRSVPDGGAATSALRVRVRAPGDGLVVLADAFSEANKDSESNTLGGGCVFQPQSWSVIRPGETVSLEFYLRPTNAGVLDAPFVVLYEPPEPAPPSLRFRLVRVAARMEVTPSLEISAKVSDAATHPAARVIRVAARNVSSADKAEEPKTSQKTFLFFVRAVRLCETNCSYPLASVSSECEGSDARRKDVVLRPLVVVESDQTSKEASKRRGLLIEPKKARDVLFTAGPLEAFDLKNAIESDVVSYVGVSDASFNEKDVDEERTHVAALSRLVRASSVAKCSTKNEKARDASRRENRASKGTGIGEPTSRKTADALAGRDVVVEWEAVSFDSGERAFFGAHAFSFSPSDAPSDAVRFTLDGPPDATVFENGREKSVSARFSMRVYNPSSFEKKVTFESSQRGKRVGDAEDDDARKDDVARFTERVPASGWTETMTNGRANTDTAAPPLLIASLPPGRPWLWTGPVTRSVSVPSGATATIELVATAFSAGVFPLSDFRLIVRRIGDGEYAKESDDYVAQPQDASDAPFLWTVKRN